MQDKGVTVAVAQSLEDEVATLHREHAGELLRYARGAGGCEELAREAVQETFLRYFIERTYGREIVYQRAWLFEVLRNYLRDRASAAAIHRELPMEHAELRPDLRPSPEMVVGGIQTAEKIAESLSPREFECLRLRTQGLSYGEIGTVMQVRTGTVGALLARVHEKVRKVAGTEGGEDLIASAIFELIQERTACSLG
jgi:RNA polymerase sigma-70 factor (ECF subfamily)